MVVEEGNDLVNNFDTCKSTTLGLANLLWIATPLRDKIDHVEHDEMKADEEFFSYHSKSSVTWPFS